MNKFLCLTLSALSILGFSSAQATEEEWDRGYEIGFENQDMDRQPHWNGIYYREHWGHDGEGWSEDQRDGCLQGHWDRYAQDQKELEKELFEYKEKLDKLEKKFEENKISALRDHPAFDKDFFKEMNESIEDALDFGKEDLNKIREYTDLYKDHKEERRKEWEKEKES